MTSAHVFGGGVTKLGKAKQVAGRVVLDGGPEWTVGPEYFGALLPGAAIHWRGRDGYGKLSRCPLSTPKVTSSVVPASTCATSPASRFAIAMRYRP